MKVNAERRRARYVELRHLVKQTLKSERERNSGAHAAHHLFCFTDAFQKYPHFVTSVSNIKHEWGEIDLLDPLSRAYVPSHAYVNVLVACTRRRWICWLLVTTTYTYSKKMEYNNGITFYFSNPVIYNYSFRYLIITLIFIIIFNKNIIYYIYTYTHTQIE